jgi:hypothetical protein
MARRHIISYLLFVLAALFLLFAVLSTSGLRGAPGIVVTLALLLGGIIFYRRGK